MAAEKLGTMTNTAIVDAASKVPGNMVLQGGPLINSAGRGLIDGIKPGPPDGSTLNDPISRRAYIPFALYNAAIRLQEIFNKTKSGDK